MLWRIMHTEYGLFFISWNAELPDIKKLNTVRVLLGWHDGYVRLDITGSGVARFHKVVSACIDFAFMLIKNPLFCCL